MTFAADIDDVVSLSAWAHGSKRPMNLTRFPGCKERFIRPVNRSYRLPGPTKHSVQCVLLALFRELKRTEHELGHPHPCVAHVKNEWSSEPAPLCSFVACTGIILRIVVPN